MTLRSPAESSGKPRDSRPVTAQAAGMTISLLSAQVIREYLRWMKAKKLADSTISSVSSTLHGLALRAEAHILDVDENGIRDWQEMRAGEVSTETLRKDGSYVRCFFAWAQMTGKISSDPSVAFQAPRAVRRLPRPMPEDHVAEAIGRADGDVLAILALAAFGGARAVEIARLDWSEVMLTGRTPRMRLVGKGQHERIVDIAPPLADALAALPNRHGPVIRRRDGRPGHVTAKRASSMANEFLKAQRIAERLHSLRHRFGTRVYEESGGDIRATQEALGHASPTTTAIYAAVVRGSVRAAILAAGRLRPDDEDGDEPPLTAPASR